MNSNTKWVLAGLILLTIIGLQLYALYEIPQTYAEEMDAIKKEKEVLETEKAALEQENTQMESELFELKDQLQSIEERFEETKEELESTIKELEKDLEQSNEEIQQLKQINQQKEQENKRLQRELQSRKEKRQVQVASRSRDSGTANSQASQTANNQSSKQSSSSHVLTGFEVTWYNTSGTTASGRPTQDGVTIAVDPNVIPLGTWVKLTFPDGTVQKRRADDTGAAVRGRKIDIYKDAPTNQLLSLGRVSGVKVEILD
ncbi:3D (Asp-Asp-Asp) domain-containing protein/prefoldin subunit 5 [Caldalkalibacillus uzonensis]|uniref:3D (Asp-Asp-Asp) domain-containing protein/prefoldin subunit 5 n=1 Tax=Caldalkalibacillus uzonensis TaxID=353224 RepID=A0ABU0CR99_9BACI|nr:3D domain-containing protein [Caldalkalibacillus uzonensis]MDQ0338930.1 3D (Asp-Asp-Asp) domain-containing protein/prefoldin subunit 5 [Caldalkalibacillus uzonensis]